MTNRAVRTYWRSAVLVLCGLWLTGCLLYSQQDVEPGHSIGKVSTIGELIVIELDEGALESANLFDLTGHTLRFVLEGSGYRVASLSLRWDGDYGPELTGSEVTLRKFAFPFSGKSWKSLEVG
ncbi:MAG TPA: hypothetical protein VF772_11420, partial [Terriglobales bacterium]